MTRAYMINCLKKLLPYTNNWYTKLADKQVYVIYMKYCVYGQKLPFQDEIIEEKKILTKRRIYNGYNQVLADNGNWENEID